MSVAMCACCLLRGEGLLPSGPKKDLQRLALHKLYRLNSDGSWKPTQTSAGQILEKDRLEYLADSRARQIEDLQGEVERLRDWASGSDANGANNVALSNLIKIVADNSASPRQRLRAAAAVLGYKTPNDIIDFVKKYLESLCGSDEAVDYKIEASELLRKHEAPRVTPESVRPSYRDSEGTEAERREGWRNYEIAARELKIIVATKDVPPPGWDDDLISDNYVPPAEGWPGPVPVIPLKDLVVARKARADRMEREMALAMADGARNGGDEPSEGSR